MKNKIGSFLTGSAADKLPTDVNSQRWIRLPTHGHCPCTGLTRGAFYELIKENKIRTACIKKPGALRGSRFVWLPSVMAYLEQHATGGDGGTAKPVPTSSEKEVVQ